MVTGSLSDIRRLPGCVAAAPLAFAGPVVLVAGQPQRDRHREPRPNPRLALGRDVAAEDARELLAKRQPQPRAAEPLLDRGIDLDEILENGAQVLPRDPDAGV